MLSRNEWDKFVERRKYAWGYFQYHASQRLTTFNFYIVICTLIGAAYCTVVKADGVPFVGTVLGLLLCFVSFIFWRLDCRNKQMIVNVQKALKELEKQDVASTSRQRPSVLQIFRYEEAQTKTFTNDTSRPFWQKHYRYSECFTLVFRVFFVVGFCAAVYAFWRFWSELPPSFGAGGMRAIKSYFPCLH